MQSGTAPVNEGAIDIFLAKPGDDDQPPARVQDAFQYKEMVDEIRRPTTEVHTANQELTRANRQLKGALQHKPQPIQRREVILEVVREVL